MLHVMLIVMLIYLTVQKSMYNFNNESFTNIVCGTCSIQIKINLLIYKLLLYYMNEQRKRDVIIVYRYIVLQE